MVTLARLTLTMTMITLCRVATTMTMAQQAAIRRMITTAAMDALAIAAASPMIRATAITAEWLAPRAALSAGARSLNGAEPLQYLPVYLIRCTDLH